MPLPVYVINLDRRRDRWKAVSQNLRNLGIEGERISAVDARLLEARKTDGEASLWKTDVGAVATMLGHSTALISLLARGAPAALVLEDDVELAPDVAVLLESTAWWPPDAMVIRLEDAAQTGPQWTAQLRHPSGNTPSGRSLRRLERWIPGAAAYLISREGAWTALPALVDPVRPVDYTLFDLRSSETARQLRTVQVVPAMARQRLDSSSDLAAWRRKAERRGASRRFSRLLRKFHGRPYKTKLLALRTMGGVGDSRISYSDTP